MLLWGSKNHFSKKSPKIRVAQEVSINPVATARNEILGGKKYKSGCVDGIIALFITL